MHLSTHDLTQRSTRFKDCPKSAPDLSTHDLTQRSTRGAYTGRRIFCSFNSRPHAEVDHAFFLAFVRNEVFQLTTSRRGRRILQTLLGPDTILSTHDLTQRSTDSVPTFFPLRDFQLTTSRRGRQNGGNHYVYFKTFNSRPHAEVDPVR